ncbi:MAG: hypothetical protein ACPG4T_05825 [Nannocystaceae bacterium]
MPRLLLPAVAIACAVSCQAEPATETTVLTMSDTDHDSPRVTTDLVDPNLWQPRSPTNDPFSEHRPASVECGLSGALVENGALEINTNNCNYYAAFQPMLVGLETGDPVTIELRHFDLVAPEPATAHVAIEIAGDTVWEQTIDIPGPAAVLKPSWVAPRDYPAGTAVDIHLHNHGQNTWTLAWIRGDVKNP